jgi:hypothetical protein
MLENIGTAAKPILPDMLTNYVVEGLSEHLVVIQLVKRFHAFMEPTLLSPYSEKPAIGQYPKPTKSSSHYYNLFLYDPFSP